MGVGMNLPGTQLGVGLGVAALLATIHVGGNIINHEAERNEAYKRELGVMSVIGLIAASTLIGFAVGGRHEGSIGRGLLYGGAVFPALYLMTRSGKDVGTLLGMNKVPLSAQ